MLIEWIYDAYSFVPTDAWPAFKGNVIVSLLSQTWGVIYVAIRIPTIKYYHT